MKILGIGVDIIKNERIRKLIKSNKFKSRIYTAREIKLSKKTKNKKIKDKFIYRTKFKRYTKS